MIFYMQQNVSGEVNNKMREYLVALREQRNESQQDVADALNISRQYYAMIENSERQRRMDISLASAIATHFKIPVAQIINEESNI